MISLIRKRMKGEKGFTLIELLVVIIIIAILAAIAIPTFLGQRTKAQNVAAKSLIRNSMTAMESTYTDTQSFENVTYADLTAIEPAIAWMADAGTAGLYLEPNVLATASTNAVDWAGTDKNSYELGTWSASGIEFGIKVIKDPGGGITYAKGTVADAAGEDVANASAW